jgi:hypothetical protein
MHTASRSGDEGAAIAPRRPGLPVEGPSDAAGLYLAALRELQQREGEVLRVVATIQMAAKALERWQAVHVAHAGVGFPKEVVMVGRAIDAATWPTGQQLADALAAWHEALELARTRWAGLSGEARSRRPPP